MTSSVIYATRQESLGVEKGGWTLYNWHGSGRRINAGLDQERNSGPPAL